MTVKIIKQYGEAPYEFSDIRIEQKGNIYYYCKVPHYIKLRLYKKYNPYEMFKMLALYAKDKEGEATQEQGKDGFNKIYDKINRPDLKEEILINAGLLIEGGEENDEEEIQKNNGKECVRNGYYKRDWKEIEKSLLYIKEPTFRKQLREGLKKKDWNSIRRAFIGLGC